MFQLWFLKKVNVKLWALKVMQYNDSLKLALYIYVVRGYIPSLTMASPTHLLIMTAIMIGTMYVSPPVSSNIITTRDTVGEGQ